MQAKMPTNLVIKYMRRINKESGWSLCCCVLCI